MNISVEQLAQQLLSLAEKQGPTGTPSHQQMHGAGGIFSTLGIDQTVINAHISPSGLDQALTAFGTVYTNPIFPFLTGFDDDGAEETQGPCDNCPGGVIESCNQVATFGRICRSSQEIEVNQIVEMLNRGETTPLQLIGQVLTPGGMTPQISTPQGWINYVTQAQMVTIGVLFQRKLSQMVWQGDPANNTAGGYAEFPGLDMLISTGKVDAITGTACAALDSDIKDFKFNSLYGTTPDITMYVSMMEFMLRSNASRMGLEPLEMVIVMRRELFFELSAVWPCRYLSSRCADTPAATMVINDNVNVTMRDNIRNSLTLPINGRNYRVILDDGIYEENSTTSAELAAGEFASDISFVPLRAAGRTVTYWEYKNYQGAVSEVSQFAGRSNPYWVSDGGRYMWILEHLNWCFYIMGKVEPRIILRTPQLAGRIENIKYSPLQHLRSPFPDSPYFAKGGVESYEAPYHYSEWNPPSAQ